MTAALADHPSPGGARASLRDAWGRARSPAVLGGLGLLLLAFYVAPYVIRGYRFAVGADAPVYLWWARIAGRDGLSATGYRPGVPALALVVRGTLRFSPAQTVAAIGAAVAAALGLAAAALAGARSQDPHANAPEARSATVTWALAGLFAGLFAATLANGYMASLTAGVLCLGAMGSLVAGRRGGTVLAAALLGAAGLTHVAFLLVGIAVLLVAGAWGAVVASPRGVGPAMAAGSEGRRILAAVVGGAVVAGAGLAATLGAGAGPIPDPDTSKDAFLRRVGLSGDLHDLYRSRLGSNWLRSLLPVHAPLAVYGALPERGRPVGEPGGGLRRRILLAWLVVSALGIAFSLAAGFVPGERFLAFCFALPILGAAGVARLWRLGGRGSAGPDGPGRGYRWARPVALLAVAAVVAGSALAWWHPAESIRGQDMAAAGTAARVAEALPPGTPLVFVVDVDEHPAIGIPRWGNELRGAMPSDRIRDVHLFVGGPADYLARRPTRTGDAIHDLLSTRYLQDLRAALRHATRPAVAFVLRPMNERGFDQVEAEGTRMGPGVIALGLHTLPGPGGLPPVPDPARPTSPWLIALSAAAALALLWLVGFGWASAALRPGPTATVTAIAAAPAAGLAALVLAGTLVDRLGVRLTGAVPVILSATVAGGGYLAWRRFGLDRERGVLER